LHRRRRSKSSRFGAFDERRLLGSAGAVRNDRHEGALLSFVEMRLNERFMVSTSLCQNSELTGLISLERVTPGLFYSLGAQATAIQHHDETYAANNLLDGVSKNPAASRPTAF